MSRLSTHILDTANGCPAAGIKVSLYHQNQLLSTQITNTEGRVSAFLPPDSPLLVGTYRLIFDIASYSSESFFPEVAIAFRVTDVTANYHVPLLLSPFGYSTYRGS